MHSLTQAVAHGLLLSQVSAHQLRARASPLDKNLTNTVPNGSGPVLYYNGSGPVPGIDVLSPEPEPLHALRSACSFTCSRGKPLLTIGQHSANLQCHRPGDLRHRYRQVRERYLLAMHFRCRGLPYRLIIPASGCHHRHSHRRLQRPQPHQLGRLWHL